MGRRYFRGGGYFHYPHDSAFVLGGIMNTVHTLKDLLAAMMAQPKESEAEYRRALAEAIVILETATPQLHGAA